MQRGRFAKNEAASFSTRPQDNLVARRMNWLSQWRRRLEVVQFAGVDHVQTLFADALEAGDDLPGKRFHAVGVSFVPGEIEVHVPPDKAVRHARKARQRILDASAKQLLAPHV